MLHQTSALSTGQGHRNSQPRDVIPPNRTYLHPQHSLTLCALVADMWWQSDGTRRSTCTATPRKTTYIMSSIPYQSGATMRLVYGENATGGGGQGVTMKRYIEGKGMEKAG